LFRFGLFEKKNSKFRITSSEGTVQQSSKITVALYRTWNYGPICCVWFSWLSLENPGYCARTWNSSPSLALPICSVFFLACGHVDEVSLEATQRDERMITTCAYTSCVRAQGQIKLQVNVQYAISTKRCLLDLLFFSHDALANLTDCDLAQK
jgi:hypothetical protein